MLFERSAHGAVGIEVEEQEALGQLAEVEAFGVEQCRYHLSVVSLLHQCVDVLTVELGALLVEGCIEAEELDVVEEHVLKVGDGLVMTAGEEFEQVLEHAAGSARCGHELHDAVVGLQIFVPLSRCLLQGILVSFYYSIGY